MKTKLLLLLTICLMSFGMNAQINSVALVGLAVGGWPGDPGNPGPLDVHQLTQFDADNWIIENIVINAGSCKLRANNTWGGEGFEWAGSAFPTGIGTSSGDIIVTVAGAYTVILNTATNVYEFLPAEPGLPIVKLIGTAVAPVDGIMMSTNDLEIYTATNITLSDGTAQFSIQNDGETLILGETNFPTGTLTLASNNIPIVAGNYSSITLNFITGEYSFVLIPTIPFPLISINGSGVLGVDADMITTDGINYTYIGLTTFAGGIKFRTNHNWTEPYYGSTNFPSGTATVSGVDIPIPAGVWDVTFNLNTREYNFISTASFGISIVGSAAGGWPGDPGNPGPVDIHQLNSTDGIHYTLYGLTLTDGAVKFRQNNDWTINWGGGPFPSGVATIMGGGDIYVEPGIYSITFNRNTGEYSFGDPLRIAIVGTAVGGWPTGEIGEIDAHRLDSDDGVNFRLDNISLTDGLVKFRQNNSWDINWGGNSLNGTLVLNGPEIPVAAGTYTIAMNRVTGDYSLSSEGFKFSYFKIYPNPTQNVWNFTSAKQTIETIQIVDVLGKTVMTIAPKDLSATVDASSLTKGLYFAKISTANATETAKLMKN